MTEWTTYWEAHYQHLRKLYYVAEWEAAGHTHKASYPKDMDFRNSCASIHHQSVKNRRAHTHWMIEQLPKLVAEGRVYKAQRWLGFLHAYAVCVGMVSLSDLMEQTRNIEDQFCQSVNEEKLVACPKKFVIEIEGMDVHINLIHKFGTLYRLYQKTIDSKLWFKRRCYEIIANNEALIIELRKSRDKIEELEKQVKDLTA
jgi:hypothetical protein